VRHVPERLRAAIAVAAIVAVPVGLACNAPPEPTGPHAAIAKVHRAHCGACHTRVDPGQRTRAPLEAALAHHHNRVHLTDAEWKEMVDYLAADRP
jgi:hypothetical protein